MQRTHEQKALYMALNDALIFALRCGGIGWDEAIQTLEDQIAAITRRRDRGADPLQII